MTWRASKGPLAPMTQSRFRTLCLISLLTAYHIKDWLKTSMSHRYSVDEVETHYQNSQVLLICRDICDSSKHQALTRRPPVAAEQINYSVGPQALLASLDNAPALDTTHGVVKIRLFNGAKYEVLDFGARVISSWEQFFRNHGLDLE